MGGDPSSYTMGKTPQTYSGYATTGSGSTLVHAQNKVIVIIRDSQDSAGTGMTFSLAQTSRFKNIFDAFKASSCKFCKPETGVRFKHEALRLHDEDTPKKVSSKTQMQIRSYDFQMYRI